MKRLLKKKNYLLVTLLFFCLSIPLHSWDIKARRVLSTGVYNGCITQDKEGLLWIGTWGRGLMCYDGYELKELKVEDETGPVKIVPSIFVDSRGIIWFLGLGVGLFSYDKNTGLFKCYKSEANNPNSLTSNRFIGCQTLLQKIKMGIFGLAQQTD
jgi:ligand-binding sensor domain-containing protein